MRKGYEKGGKIITPVRKMLGSDAYDSVSFYCESEDHAESIRVAALMLKYRHRYDIHTKRSGTVLTVYRGEKDGYIRPMSVRLERTRRDA